MACIVIFCVTEEHTPVDELNVPPHDPLVIVKPLNVYPALVHFWACDGEPEGTV